MSTLSPRYVIVDDTDPGIQYTGVWFPDQGTENAWSRFGAAFNRTQHGTISNASLSYAFSGSWVRVTGSTNTRNDSGVIDPSWECFIDNVSIGATYPSLLPENNWPLCQMDGLPDGPHVLAVNATVRNEQMFWIDTLRYVPSASVALDQKTILVDSFDPQFQYGSGWGKEGQDGWANETSQQGSTFTFDFIGVSLMWFGILPGDAFPVSSSTATYSIDGQTPINFVINGLNSSTERSLNQKFFETGKLNPGSHRLSVVYTSATNKSIPLTLSYLVIQNGTTTSTSSGIAPSFTGSSGSGGSTSGSGNNNTVGPIVGGVMGGLAAICLIIILLRRWWRETGGNEASSSKIPEPFLAPAPASSGNEHSLQVTTQPFTRLLHPLSPKAQREAEAAAAAALARRPVQLSAAPARSNNPGSPRPVIMHEDSGVRLPVTPVLEVPPMYTPG